jgi:hypothetical protein
MLGDSFVLLDLVSQGRVVQSLLKGLSVEEKLQWLRQHGKVAIASEMHGFPKTYFFESRVRLEAFFFFHGDEIMFCGDHTTFRAKQFSPHTIID